MQDIKITRYRNPKATGWAGYFQPSDMKWIAFIGLDGIPRVFLHRDPESGAILGDDPAQHEADIAALRSEGGLRTGMASDGSAIMREGERDPLELGERVFPLGVHGGDISE